MRFPGIKIDFKILIIGKIIVFIKGSFPKMGKISPIKIRNPNLFKKMSTLWASLEGRSPTKIFPPSKGWIGIRLNIAKEILRRMKIGRIPKRKENKENGEEISLKMTERIMAKTKFAAGPANDIKAESL